MERVEESTGSNTTPSSQSPVWFETNDQQNFTPTTHNSPGNLTEFNIVPEATSSFDLNNFDFTEPDARFFNNLLQFDEDAFYFSTESNDTMGLMPDLSNAS